MLRRQASRTATARNSAGASDISSATIHPQRVLCAIHLILLLYRMGTCIFGAWLLLCVVLPELTNLINSVMDKSTLLSTCKSKFEGGILNLQQQDLG